MMALRIGAILLIVAGAWGLAQGSFTYTQKTREAKLGPLELAVKDKEKVKIPTWAGVGAIVLGSGILLTAGRKR